MTPNDKKYQAEKCHCPNCEEELKMGCFEPPFCTPCQIKFKNCKTCGEMFGENLKTCPHCGKMM